MTITFENSLKFPTPKASISYLPLLLILRRRPEQRRELEPVDPRAIRSRSHCCRLPTTPKTSKSPFFDHKPRLLKQRAFNSDEADQNTASIKITKTKQHKYNKIQSPIHLTSIHQNSSAKPPDQSPVAFRHESSARSHLNQRPAFKIIENYPENPVNSQRNPAKKRENGRS